MAAGKMHAGEVAVDAALVRRLLAGQFPQWADLPLKRVESAGTDNAIFRLGDDMAVRLPRIDWATAQVHTEARWLPRLAPYLPLTLPVPLALGDPAEGYPWHWAVCDWLPGENATLDRLHDEAQAARDMAAFIRAMQAIDTNGGPRPRNMGRGVPLAVRDDYTRKAIAESEGMVDTDAVIGAWEAALAAPAWDGPPVWIHGDLQSGNLLAVDGRLSAVIDFGCLGVGDPACELIVAWNLFSRVGREALRAALDVDDATWARGAGWALSVAMVALPYYHVTNPVLAGIARYTLGEVLADG